jgi:hypothetical protein
MCRNIKTLFNFNPPVTAEEIQAASLQFARKISGFNKPSKANEAAFLAAVDEIAASADRLLHSLDTNAPPKESRRRGCQGKGSRRREIRDLKGVRENWAVPPGLGSLGLLLPSAKECA